MSKHDGTATGSKAADAAAKPFVLEVFDIKSFVYRPIKNGRFATLDEAITLANSKDPRVRSHIVKFGEDRKPKVVWES